MKFFFLEKHLTHLIIFVVLCLAFNMLMYRNYMFVFLMLLFLIVFLYQNPNVLNKPQNQKRELTKIIESFDLQEFGTNMYDIYKLPKAFKYIFIKPDISNNLIDLQFTKKFNNELYTKTFVVLEKFLKLYYNAITDRANIDKEIVLDTLTQLHEEFKHYKEEMKMNIPIMSKHIKRFKNKTLHRVVDDNYMKIDKFMKHKIKILKSVNRE